MIFVVETALRVSRDALQIGWNMASDHNGDEEALTRDKLREVIKLDSIKNGLLLADGYCIVRVRYMLKGLSQKSARTLWEMISKQLDTIEKKFPSKDRRFIELEIK